MSEHVLPKRKPRTAEFYRDIFDRIVNPAFGCMKADKLTRQQVTKLHSSLHETPFQANRVLATLGSLFGFAARTGIFPTAGNPARNIDKFRENRRERFLSSLELTKLGRAIHIAETIGLPWQLEGGATLSKHLAAPEKRFSRISPFVAASLRLLLFTGCRLREILNLRWEHVDFERGLLLLPDSKSGRKTIVLNAPALSVLANLTRTGAFVISSGNPDKPRADLKAPWRSILKHAALEGLRLHDLRHTYASIGAGGGLGLPVIGKLLGHSQATTTARYAHLDNDPLRNATESIGGRIAAALEGRESGSLIRRTG
jgi:integrase